MSKISRLLAVVLVLSMLATVIGCGGNDNNNEDSEGFVNESTITLPDLEINSDKVYMLTWEDPSVLTTPSAYMYTVNEKLKQEYGVSLEFIRTLNVIIRFSFKTALPEDQPVSRLVN